MAVCTIDSQRSRSSTAGPIVRDRLGRLARWSGWATGPRVPTAQHVEVCLVHREQIGCQAMSSSSVSSWPVADQMRGMPRRAARAVRPASSCRPPWPAVSIARNGNGRSSWGPPSCGRWKSQSRRYGPPAVADHQTTGRPRKPAPNHWRPGISIDSARRHIDET